jgi:hypothetical protein
LTPQVSFASGKSDFMLKLSAGLFKEELRMAAPASGCQADIGLEFA